MKININCDVKFNVSAFGKIYLDKLSRESLNLPWVQFKSFMFWAFMSDVGFYLKDCPNILTSAMIGLKIDGKYDDVIINVNTPIRVELTDWGQSVMAQRNGNGAKVQEMTLLDYMSLCGDKYYMGSVNTMTEKNEIEFLELP